MKIMFLQELTGGLLGGLFKGLLKNRLNGLLAKTPVLAVLFLTAIITACASGDSKSSAPTPADCMFAEDASTKNCGLIDLTPFDSITNYTITVGEVGEVNTTKIVLDNFRFTQIINGNISDPKSGAAPLSGNQLTLEANATALNLTIIDIDDDVFGNFYIELVKSDDDTVKVRYTISITAVNDVPVFSAGVGSGQFANATGATPARYTFTDIPFNSAAGYSVGNVSATDPDGDAVRYSIDGGTDEIALFQINSATGEITLKAIADADSAGDYTFNVTASDGKKDGIAMAEITVSVLPSTPNQAPVFVAGNSPGVQFTPAAGTTPASYRFAGIPISFPIGYLAGSVSATDANNDAISYNISGDADVDALFEINPTTGEINLKDTAANAGNYTFNTTANDGKGGSTTATITVTVDDTPPVFTRTNYGSGVTLAVASAAGAVAGNVWAVDEAGTPFDYSLAGNSNLFGLASADNADGTRSIITTRAATLSDFAVPSVTFQVIATHQVGGLLSTANIRITLITNSDTDGINDFYDSFPFNGAMNVTGSGNSSHPYIISNIYQLQAIAGVDHEGTALDSSDFTNNQFLYGTNASDQLTKHYILANDIDASATNTGLWNKSAVGDDNFIGRGWTPIAGNSSQSFSGSFSGDGYAINNLTSMLRQGDNSKHFGLFGINNGTITALGLQDVNMRIQAPGDAYTKSTTIDNITLGSHTGMLAALNQEDGIIIYSYATGFVNASLDAVGGLVGVNEGEISYSYSAAEHVGGDGDTGGLVGANEGGAILSSYVVTVCVQTGHGIVGGNGTAGGLAGSISGEGAIINTSYIYTGSVEDINEGANFAVGAIVGERDDDRIGGSNVTIESTYSRHVDAYTTVDKERADGKYDDGRSGDNTGTTAVEVAQLQGCKRDRMVIAGVDPAPDCSVLFPSSHWRDNTDSIAGITRGWIFNAGEYPFLRAVRTSDNQQLLPSTAQQRFQRPSPSRGCPSK